MQQLVPLSLFSSLSYHAIYVPAQPFHDLYLCFFHSLNPLFSHLDTEFEFYLTYAQPLCLLLPLDFRTCNELHEDM
jgi:hypothetical protein